MADVLDFSDLGAKPEQTLDFSDIGAKPDTVNLDFSDLGAKPEQSLDFSDIGAKPETETRPGIKRGKFGIPEKRKPGEPTFSEALASSPDMERAIGSAQNPAMAIFDAMPRVTEQTVQDALDVFAAAGPGPHEVGAPRRKPGTAAKVITGGRRAMQVASEGLSEPITLAAMAVPPAGLVGRLVSIGFGADMLSHMPAQVAELKRATDEKDTAGQVKSTIGLLLSGLFAGLAIKHGLTKDTPVVRSLAESIVTGRDTDPMASRLQSEIKRAREEGASPEFRSFFGGIDPEIAGTTPAKVSEFARSMGMEYKPQPKEPVQPPTVETPVQTPAPPVQPPSRPAPVKINEQVRLVPVLELPDGRFFPGISHADALARVLEGSKTGQVSPEDLEEATMAQVYDSQHKFLNIDTGKVLNRSQAGAAVGYPGDLQSEYLPRKYKEASLPTARMLSVMTPEERADYLSKKTPKPVNETAPPTPAVPVPAPGQVVEEAPIEQDKLNIGRPSTFRTWKEYDAWIKSRPDNFLLNALEAQAENLSSRLAEEQQGIIKPKLDDRSKTENRINIGTVYREAVTRGLSVPRSDVLSRYTGVSPNETASQTPSISQQASSGLAQETQAQDLPPDPQGVPVVPPAVEAPAPAQLPYGQVAVQDLGQVKAVDLNPFKTPIEVQYDPGMVKGSRTVPGVKEAGLAQLVIAINQPGKFVNQLLIQLPGPTPRTIWSAQVRDLEQSGVLTRTGTSFVLDTEALYASPFLTKSTESRFKAYKLPGQKLDRSQGFTSEDVEIVASRNYPFLGAVLSQLNLSPIKLRALAGAKSGGRVYAGKDAGEVAKQVRAFLLRDLEQKLLKKKNRMDSMDESELEQMYVEARLRTAIRDDKRDFTPEEISEAASYIATIDEAQKSDAPRNEVPIAELGGTVKDNETGVEQEVGEVGGGVWDQARLDSMIGRIEDKNPELYKSFAADLENKKAWDIIEQELVKFLNGDRAGAEVLRWAIIEWRQERGGLMGGLRPEGAEFEEHNWMTGISATGKDGILSMLENRNIPLDPDVRSAGLLFIRELPSKYFNGLTLSIDATGSAGGEFIPWLKVARIFMYGKNPDIVPHEVGHYLASFLTEKERGVVNEARQNEIELTKEDKSSTDFFQFLNSNAADDAGNVTSANYKTFVDVRAGQGIDVSRTDLYHLINNDEYFAYYLTGAASKPTPELKTLLDKVKDIILRIITAIKAWLGNRDAYFDQLWRRFKKGEFDVNAQGGMLFERNNRNKPKSLPPIKSMTELRKYQKVDQGVNEAAIIRTLTHEQNHPLVAHAKGLFEILPRSVRAELPGIASRLAALEEIGRQGGPAGTTPLRHYGVVVNSLALQEEAQKLGDEIEQIVEEIQKQNLRGDKSSLAEVRAKQLEEMAQSSISDYKNLLLSEQKRTQNDGVAQGLAEAIKTLDGLRDSTESLKRAIAFIAEGVTMEQLTNTAMNTQEVVNLFKARIMELTGAATWQQAVIPPGKDRPGVNNEQLRIAVRILQENQRLVQDLITHKELSDPEFARIMREGEKEFDNHIAGLTYRELRSFLKTYHSIRSAKDRARQVYLKHRLKLKDLIEKLEVKTEADDFMHGQVLGSVQFKSAVAEAAKHNFQSAELVRDHSGNSATKRTYYNPLNKEEFLEIIDGPTLADYERNRENFDKVLDWYDKALESDLVDPLDKEAIKLESFRINDQEFNEAYGPKAGKRVDWWLNTPSSIFANFVGHSFQYAMSKIGGRAGIQVGAMAQARSEALRRTIEVRHEQQPLMQKTIKEAMRGHTMTETRWVTEVAEPVLASYNSLGAKQLKATDITRYGHRVSGKDMEAIRLMKKFADSMAEASRDMNLHTAKLHPIRIKEVVAGREILRDPQGSSELTVPRRWNWDSVNLLDSWSKVKNQRKLSDATKDLVAFAQTGAAFDRMVLSHIYSTQRYPDYDIPARFKQAYREIYRRILNGQAPASFNEVVDIVFQDQTGTDVALQLTREKIAEEIIKELDQFANKVLDERSKDRAADTPGMQVRVESADNFMTKPRGKMIAPDSFYRYSIVNRDDIKWLVRSVQEVHEQVALDGLEKVKKMLEEYVAEWEDRAKHPKAQKESMEQQLSGESWLNYREARNMLNQVRRHIEKSSPEAFRTFVDEQFGTTGRRIWSIQVQALLQSANVLKNNLFGMNLRQNQFDQQWRADGIWMGMPRWLIKLPTLAKNAIALPITNIPAYLSSAYSYRKTLKKGVSVNVGSVAFSGEEALRVIVASPDLANAVVSQVKGATLKRAINIQRAKDLGAYGRYGLGNQLSKYITMFTQGGEIEQLDPTRLEKIHGGINSVLGLFQELGTLPIANLALLPKAFAPRKLEEILNFQALRYADILLEELDLNIREALADRARLGITQTITDAELLGDARASDGNAMYMRKMFNRAGLNLDALILHLERDPASELLSPSEWNSFSLEVAKELNMPGRDNRPVFKSGFARLMTSLMGYGIWYNERTAEALARSSQKKFDMAAVYRAMYFLGAIVAMGVFVGVPIQRLIKRLINNEEDQTGHFSADNTAWRNAGVLWEQTAVFWPIIGSVMSQLYDARTGGGKLFNFLPVSVAAQALQSANETAQTGNAFYPTVRLIRSWMPNSKIILNRLPATEGLIEVNSAGRILRSTAAGDVEVRSQKGGGNIKYSPVSTQIQMAVNELAKEDPDYNAINHYRDDAVKELVKRGAKKEDAQRRFDLSVLTRFPENTVFGRPLTTGERTAQRARMTSPQASRLSQVEQSFDRYAATFGLREPSQQRQSRNIQGRTSAPRSFRGSRPGRRRTARLVRNRRLTRRRSRRLVRG